MIQDLMEIMRMEYLEQLAKADDGSYRKYQGQIKTIDDLVRSLTPVKQDQ